MTTSFKKVSKRRVSKPKTKVVKKARRSKKSLNPSKSNTKIQGIMGMATETVFSKTSRKLKKRSAGLTAEAAPCIWLINKTVDINGAIGGQTITTLGQWNSVADIQAMSNLTFANSSALSGSNPTRFCVHSLQAEVQISNVSSLSTQIDLYDIVCRRDAPTSGTPTYDVSIAQNAWTTGVALEATLTNAGIPGLTSQALIAGSVPSDSQLFKDFYKVVQRKQIVLLPGGQHIHKVNIRLNKEFDKNLLSALTSSMSGLKGLTYTTIAVCRGQPVSLGGQTTMANAFLRCVATERYQYSAVYRNGTQFTYVNNLTNPGPGALGVTVLNLNNPAFGPVVAA